MLVQQDTPPPDGERGLGKGLLGVAGGLLAGAFVTHEIDEHKNFVQGIDLTSQHFIFNPINTASSPTPLYPCINCSLPSYFSLLSFYRIPPNRILDAGFGHGNRWQMMAISSMGMSRLNPT